jgi:hypothetical protein
MRDLASIPPSKFCRVLEGVGDFQMHRLLLAVAAITVIAAFAISKMDDQQVRVVDDGAHRQCVAVGYIPGTPFYLQCRGQVVQTGTVRHREAVAQ